MEEQRDQQSASMPNPTPVWPCGFAMSPELPDYGDELSIANIWRVLVCQWKVILTPAIFSVIAAAAYLSVATPRYETELRLLPPEAQHVETLNIPGVNKVSPNEVYRSCIRNLRSGALRRRFFDENSLFSVLGADRSGAEESVFRNRFHNRMRVSEGSKEQKELVQVTLEGEHSSHLAGWLNDFVDFVATATIKELLDGVEARIGNERESLLEQMEIARELAKQRRMDRLANLEEKLSVIRDGRRREDRLAVLDEQIAIARELNIVDRNDALARVLKEQSVGLSVTTAPSPLYLRGVTELVAEREALAKREDEDPFLPGLRETLAEMEVLKARTNDDPFIPGLRDQEEQLAQLDAGMTRLRESASGVVPVRIDQKARDPSVPASPKKTRILTLSLAGGLFLGVFAAFQVHALKQTKA